MNLKWLEDLVCVAQEGHFARAAEVRHITQSALSRRIKSLELWAGAELLDRSQHPIRLTAAGHEFASAARDIIRQSYDARLASEGLARGSRNAITIASLHTLALYFVPALVSQLIGKVGPIDASVIAETRTVDEYLASLSEHRTDFFLCYALPAGSQEVDFAAFDRKVIGRDRLVPYAHTSIADPKFEAASGPAIPYIAYSGTAMLSRLVNDMIEQAPFRSRLRPRYRASLAESIHTAATLGLGVAWLPETTVLAHGEEPMLRQIPGPWEVEVQIELYKARGNNRPLVERIWNAVTEEALDVV